MYNAHKPCTPSATLGRRLAAANTLLFAATVAVAAAVGEQCLHELRIATVRRNGSRGASCRQPFLLKESHARQQTAPLQAASPHVQHTSESSRSRAGDQRQRNLQCPTTWSVCRERNWCARIADRRLLPGARRPCWPRHPPPACRSAGGRHHRSTLCARSMPRPLQKLLSALQATHQVVELLSAGGPQQELNRLCSAFLSDVQARDGSGA